MEKYRRINNNNNENFMMKGEAVATGADRDDGDNMLGHVGQLCFLGSFGFQRRLVL